jgi:tetratricopeptide (TPR) repeat protein
MKTLIAALILAGFWTPALAAGDADSSSTAPKDPVIERASAAAAKKDWAAAQAILREALQKNAGNASYHNLYAYSVRKDANPDMSVVFKHYNEALRIDPKHRGAHEYIGEAYLMANNVAKAEEHLAALERLCRLPCEEHADLKAKIGAYKRRER